MAEKTKIKSKSANYKLDYRKYGKWAKRTPKERGEEK